MLQNFALTDPRVVENLTIADFALLPYYSFLSILAKANNYALKIQIAHFKVMRPLPPRWCGRTNQNGFTFDSVKGTVTLFTNEKDGSAESVYLGGNYGCFGALRGAHEFINEQYAPEDDEVGQVWKGWHFIVLRWPFPSLSVKKTANPILVISRMSEVALGIWEKPHAGGIGYAPLPEGDGVG